MGKKAYFLGDAHLGARYITDPEAHEQTVAVMLDSFAEDAEYVFMLGDIIDFWFEYRHAVPKGYTALFAAIRCLAEKGVKVYWLKGNHDMWTFGYLERELGVTIVDENLDIDIFGRRFHLGHGDAWGRIPTSYKLLRKIFRSKFCYHIGAALPTNWLLGFGQRWSAHNRTARTTPPDIQHRLLSPHLEYAEELVSQHPDTEYVIGGHLHLRELHSIAGGKATYACIGDCFEQMSYGVFDGENFTIEQFDTGGK